MSFIVYVTKNWLHSFFWIRNIGHSLLTHIMYSNVAEIAVPISCGLFPASLNWWREFGNEILVTGVWEWDLGDRSQGMRPAAAASLVGNYYHILWCNYILWLHFQFSQCNLTVYCRYKESCLKILHYSDSASTSWYFWWLSELAGHLQLNSSWVLNMHQCDYCFILRHGGTQTSLILWHGGTQTSLVLWHGGTKTNLILWHGGMQTSLISLYSDMVVHKPASYSDIVVHKPTLYSDMVVCKPVL